MKKVKIFRFHMRGIGGKMTIQCLIEIEKELEEFMKDKQIFSFTQSNGENDRIFYTIVYEE